MTTYNTNLAAEFYVLSMLHRLGFDASLSLGNKKAVDVVIVRDSGNVVTVDVKGLAGTTSWPVDNVKKIAKHHFLIFVSFLGKINEYAVQPEVYVVPSKACRRLSTIHQTGNDMSCKWHVCEKMARHSGMHGPF